MSRTDDIIDKTKRKEPDAKKWKVVVGIVMGLVLACGLLLGFYCLSDVDTYIYAEKEILHLYEFYDEFDGENSTSVFFIGSSSIGEAVYPPEINRILLDNGHNISTYNLVVFGDYPILRSTQVQNIIDAHPSLVVYGVTYRDLASENGWVGEKVILVHDSLNLRDDSLYLYSNDEIDDLNQEDDFGFKKKFMLNALRYRFLEDTSYNTLDYFNDPYGDIARRIYEADKDFQSILDGAEDENNEWRPIVPKESGQKEPFLYIIRTLTEAGIPVVLTNQPLHPLYSEKITSESRENYYNIFNDSGVVWYDFETIFGDEYFRDSHHLSWNGSLMFAPIMVDLIIQELS